MHVEYLLFILIAVVVQMNVTPILVMEHVRMKNVLATENGEEGIALYLIVHSIGVLIMEGV